MNGSFAASAALPAPRSSTSPDDGKRRQFVAALTGSVDDMHSLTYQGAGDC